MQMRTIRPPPPVPFPLLLEMKNFIFARFLRICASCKFYFFGILREIKNFIFSEFRRGETIFTAEKCG